jgi:hypothetical protein
LSGSVDSSLSECRGSHTLLHDCRICSPLPIHFLFIFSNNTTDRNKGIESDEQERQFFGLYLLHLLSSLLVCWPSTRDGLESLSLSLVNGLLCVHNKGARRKLWRADSNRSIDIIAASSNSSVFRGRRIKARETMAGSCLRWWWWLLFFFIWNSLDFLEIRLEFNWKFLLFVEPLKSFSIISFCPPPSRLLSPVCSRSDLVNVCVCVMLRRAAKQVRNL